MKEYLLNLSRAKKIIILMATDFLIGLFVWIIFGSPVATYLSTNFNEDLVKVTVDQFSTFFFPMILALFVLYVLGFYKSLTRFKAAEEGFIKAFIGAGVFGLAYILFFLGQQDSIQKNFIFVFIIQGFLLGSIFLSGILFSRESAKYFLGYSSKDIDAMPLIIYGAGVIGGELLKTIAINRSRKVIAFFDDDQDLHGTTKYGIPIISKERSLKRFQKMYSGLQIYLAIPSLSSIERRKIIEKLEILGLSVRSVPALHEIIADGSALANLQQLSLEDLLPSGRVSNLAFDYLNKKSVFVSGAGGSIGSELVRQILLNNPSELILFEQNEFNLYKVLEECKQVIKEKNIQVMLKPILGDVKNLTQLDQIFQACSIDIVFHAAAYKHVPLMEDNPGEALHTNIIGTNNVATLACKYKIPRFVLVSTDKAVNPTNVMGASKRAAEIACQIISEESTITKFMIVRFGNVLGSSGSVIPLFKDQISKGGPVTVTHRDITRYFMSIPEACQLIMYAGAIGAGGEIFVLDMGEPVKIFDLAEQMIKLSGLEPHKDIEIKITGLRKGEKLYEELLSDKEKTLETIHPKIRAGESLKSSPQIRKNLSLLLALDIKFSPLEIIEALQNLIPEFKHKK